MRQLFDQFTNSSMASSLKVPAGMDVMFGCGGPFIKWIVYINSIACDYGVRPGQFETAGRSRKVTPDNGEARMLNRSRSTALVRG